MELILTAEEQAFRDEVRAFLVASVPEAIRQKTMTGFRLGKEEHESWQIKLYEKGWMAPNWPVAHGGTGWTPMQKHIFEEECAAAGAPPIIAFGVTMVAPVLMAFGSEAQKRAIPAADPPIRRLVVPGLFGARLRLRSGITAHAGGTWTVIIMSSMARRPGPAWRSTPNMMFCLVRTSDAGKRQEGITFLLIDMTQPGITVQPIKTFDGSTEINDVFLEDVKVPVANRVGEEDKGWTYAKYLLGHETDQHCRCRAFEGADQASQDDCRRRDARRSPIDRGRPVPGEDCRRRDRPAGSRILGITSAFGRIRGQGTGPEASFLKVRGTEVQQDITELLVEAIGNYAHPHVPDALRAGWNEDPIGPEHAASIAPQYFNWRKASIYGGSNEIQKNIIAKAVLGL